MCLLTVIAMFTPKWSNLQIIGSAVTFIQVDIYKFWGDQSEFGSKALLQKPESQSLLCEILGHSKNMH